MNKLTMFLIAVFAIAGYSQWGTSTVTPTYADVNYAGDGQSYHNLDIYIPDTTEDSYPVIIVIYGSAWMSNSGKSGTDMSSLGGAMLDAGYAVVAPNHRASSDTLFPAQINDIKAVARFIRAEASTYHFDTTFIGVTGGSSGGHLSALMGTTNGVGEYTVGSATMNIEGKIGLNTDHSSSVQAVCDWFGPTDFMIMDSCGSSMSHSTNGPETALMGFDPLSTNPDKVALANPITYIDATDPPYLIFHGEDDTTVPHCESEVLYDSLQQGGVESEFVSVPNAGHYVNIYTTTNMDKMVSFFKTARSSDSIPTYVFARNRTVDHSIAVYTDAASSTLNVVGTAGKALVRYELLTPAGRVIAVGNAMGNRIDISSLQQGAYLVRLYLNNGSVVTARFIRV